MFKEWFGGCIDRAASGPVTVTLAEPVGDSPFLLGGTVLAESGAVSLEVRYADGTRARPRVAWVSDPINAGFYFYEVPRWQWDTGKQPIAVVAIDERGREVGRAQLSGRIP